MKSRFTITAALALGAATILAVAACGSSVDCRLPIESPGDGGDEETRTPDPLLAKEMLCQLSYVPGGRVMLLVGVSGLEPETSALSGQCSNQLS